MSNRPRTGRTAHGIGWRAALAVCAAVWLSGLAPAQEIDLRPRHLPATLETQAPAANSGTAAANEPIVDPAVVRIGCSTCTNGLLGPPTHDDSHYIGPGPTGCGTGQCVPGLKKCNCADCSQCDTYFGRLMCGFYDCVCCPDPCYEPHWCPLVDAAFFQDSARPQTQMRFRYDSAWNFQNPDRGEWFQARARTNPNQLEPGGPCAPTGVGKGPACIAESLDYQALRIYTEAATQTAAFFFEMSYLAIDPQTAPISVQADPARPPRPGQRQRLVPAPCCPASGFGDMTLGTKSVLIDCELLLLTFQFKTFLPTGNFTKGIGTAHVSLEPSLLFAIKLMPDLYLQGQLAYWFPIGGDQVYQSNVFHTHFALNKELWCPCPGTKLVGTCEFNNWNVFQGAYTSPTFLLPNPNAATDQTATAFAPVALGAGASMVSIGPGVRLICCDRMDLGVGSAIAVTGEHWEKQLLRVDLRFRF